MEQFKSEFLKIWYARSTKIVLLLVTVLQALMSYAEASQFKQYGLTSTPADTSSLLEAIPAIEYIGFDAIVFGIVPLMVLGAIQGASEFKGMSIRTTLLSCSSKTRIIVSKLLALTGASVVITFVATYVALIAAHLALGTGGLNPVLLAPVVWKYIGWAVASQVLLVLISFALSFLFKTATVPLLFLLPQVYLTIYLPEGNIFRDILPVSVSEGLIATSEEAFSSKPFLNVLLMSAWVVIVLAAACIRFRQLDLSDAKRG